MSSVAERINGWAPLVKVAPYLGCSPDAIHGWGKSGQIVGYKRIGPRRYDVDLAEVVPFYTAKFPNIDIDMDGLKSLVESTP